MIPITDGVIDLEQRTVRRRDGTQSLTPTEAALLGYLAERTEPSDRAQLLQEVWGYHPSVESRTVFNAVRRLRMKIEIDPGAPVHLLTVRGAGYRFQETPSADIGIDSFFGRQGDLEKLGERLKNARLVTIVGPGGIGKTRLVRRYLHQVPGIFCDLQDAQDEIDLRACVALALGATPERLEEALADAERLLVLDNVEQIVDVVGTVLPAWLEHGCFLVTSRIPLQLRGEVLHELAPLPMEAATAMFEDRIDAASTGHRGQGALITEIVKRLDCHPLALELAAARCGCSGSRPSTSACPWTCSKVAVPIGRLVTRASAPCCSGPSTNSTRPKRRASADSPPSVGASTCQRQRPWWTWTVSKPWSQRRLYRLTGAGFGCSFWCGPLPKSRGPQGSTPIEITFCAGTQVSQIAWSQSWPNSVEIFASTWTTYS